ncbi:helix-turn-helix transcriptional regulator [Clostridium sp. K12(2020)]|uniref:helix-turn-helix transcriptional regulator n=1 Tax=unclassified Clostridium TaxID=2614128 RepID=UPI001C8C8EC8|nr:MULTISPECIES: helix-turn-helix transcriptional regulator [unclassified Clostridium]MBX9136696.1 helix-turn-helix transcriptional regulator [Clostridium sp. K12(2020)]MBX9145309.1 helix-turn-helix transcriptional regulator [Clostridium sp. K13]MDU4326879.1 helix-turn-helix transcriptional regulator [Clostridium celatum]
MNKRLKILRTELDLSQAEFSNKLSIAQSTYAVLESGKTSLRDRHIKLICSTFNVNEEWLREGKGDMFVTNINQQLGVELTKIFNRGDNLTKKLILGLSELDENEIEVVKILVDGLIERKKQS